MMKEPPHGPKPKIGRLKAEWVERKMPIGEQQLLEEIMPKRENRFKVRSGGSLRKRSWKPMVAYIGGQAEPIMDPVPAFLAHKLPSGSVHLVDCNDPELFEALRKKIWVNKVPSAAKRAIRALSDGEKLNTGYGGLRTYRRALRTLGKEYGIRFGRIRLWPGLAWDTGLPKNKFDVVLDRDTLHTWIPKQGQDRVEASIDHYMDLAKIGGTVVILHYRSINSRVIETKLKSLVTKGNARVEAIPVRSEGFLFESRGGVHVQNPKYTMKGAFVVTKL